jgi:hypothetical protein
LHPDTPRGHAFLCAIGHDAVLRIDKRQISQFVVGGRLFNAHRASAKGLTCVHAFFARKNLVRRNL